MAPTTITEAVTFIQDAADESDLDVLMQSINQRSRILAQRRVADVRVGSTVRLERLSPRYLNGLDGEVVSIEGKRARVLLDEVSTETLRRAPRSRYRVPLECKRYTLGGVPLTACIPTSSND